MEMYAIPLEEEAGPGKYIIYRPLVGLAFVGNQTMARLALHLAGGSTADPGQAHPEAQAFLQTIGFDQPDPPAPPEQEIPFLPAMAVLLLTNQCQLRCLYCYAAAGEQPRQELPLEIGYAAIDQACQNAVALGQPRFEVSLHGGGEPTFAWKVMQACVEYARQKGLPAHISLTTNGIWSQAQCQWILDHVDGISLSLDGGPETQDCQRPFRSGKGSSQSVLRTVAELDRHSFPYGIRMTTIAPWQSLPDDVDFICQETGCQSIQAEPAFNSLRGSHIQPDDEAALAFAEAYLEAFEIASRAGRKLHYSGARPGTVTAYFCLAPYHALIVNPDGNLVTCYEIPTRALPLAELSTIGAIKDGQMEVDLAARARLHARIAERRGSCRECFCYWSCAGDCFTRTFDPQPGSHFRHGARCLINRTITRRLLLKSIAESGGIWRGRRLSAAPAYPQPEG